MAITGGIKFFDQNFADSKTDAFFDSISSGAPSAPFIRDRNPYTYWRSVGSNDGIIEYIEIKFPAPITYNRVFFIDHNAAIIKLQRIPSAPYTNVIGVNGISIPTDSSGFIESGITIPTSYYEFDPVTDSEIRLQLRTTQIPNQEKYLNSFVIGNELGTLQGYPIVRDATKDKKLRKSILLNGRSFVTKSLEVFRTLLDFKNYPPGLDADLDLTYSLFDRDNPFYVWLCGGRTGDPYFKYQLRGFRLEDLHLVQTVNIFKDKYRKNIYSSMVDLKLQLEESAG